MLTHSLGNYAFPNGIGTAQVLVLIGLSLVILMFGTGSPIHRNCSRAKGCDG